MFTTAQEIVSKASSNGKRVKQLLEATPYIPPASVVVPASSGVSQPTPPVGQPSQSEGA